MNEDDTADGRGGSESAKRNELKKLEQSLRAGGLSRRHFLDRMKALGVGFGAAFILGVQAADAATDPDGNVVVSSTDPALDDILAESQQDPEDDEHLSGQRRRYRRYSRRYRRYSRRYRRYARFYRRYSRVYRRYSRYSRFYARYARW